MGYQVGNVCYSDRQSAENVYFSQTAPAVTQDGLKQMQYRNGAWYYGSQQIRADLPQCDQAANFRQGWELGMELLPTALVLMAATLIIRLMR